MRVGVIGGGLMGSGIAEVCARAGVDVTVVEATTARVERRARRSRSRSTAPCARGKLEEADRAATLERLAVTDRIEDVEGADAAIEAIVEDEQPSASCSCDSTRCCPTRAGWPRTRRRCRS